MRALLLAGAAVLSLGFAAPAGAMAIDVADNTIRVTTGFTGTAMTVFGTQEQPGAVVIVVEGPPKTMTVRQKNRVMGLWTNTHSRRFENVPAFYEVAATGPLELITTPDTLRDRRIGLENLPINAARGEGSSRTEEFRTALIAMQAEKQMFVREVAPLSYPGPMLFKARFDMPALVPPGQYKVSAYLFQNGTIVEEDSTPFVVVPEGTSAQLRRFATQNGLLYGLTGMLMAVFAGWLATVLLRRE